MYPFKSPVKWWLNNRYMHLLAVLDGQDGIFDGWFGGVLERRAKGVRRWLKIRLVILVLLSFSVIAAVVGLALDAIQQADGGAVGEAAAGVTTIAEKVARIAGSLTGALTVVWFLTNRTLGQLEIDILSILATHPDLSAKRE